MEYVVVDNDGKSVKVSADRIEVTSENRVTFWIGEVIVAMFWDIKSFRQCDEE